MKLSACAVLAILVTTPVLADPPGDIARNVQASSAYTVVDPADSQPDTQHLGTCARMLERAFYLKDPVSPDRAFDARREMELARIAFQSGDEFTCQRHAAQALDDRS